MIKLLVIADDLTGAIETGVQFAKNGIKTYVSPEMNVEEISISEDTEVLVLNMESRHMSSNEAAVKTMQALEIGKILNAVYIYKKVDSTLRGNIGAELKAVLEAIDQEQLPFIPAHPNLQRFTKNGYHYVGEELLENTSFGIDPLEPVESSYIPDIIRKQSDIPVDVILIDDLKDDNDIVLSGGKIVVFDCLEFDDLRLIADVLKNNNSLSVIAGSAGLAELLPEIIEINRSQVNDHKPSGPALIVNGSLNPTSFDQVKYAEENGFASITIPSTLLSMNEIKEDSNIEKFVQDVLINYKKGNSVIIKTASTLEDLPDKQPGRFYISVAERIGIIVSNILNSLDFRTCIVFGGDTLMGILKTMKIKDIYPQDEILKGSAISIMGTEGKTFSFITKPGGFGNKDDLFQILKKINKGES